MDENRWAPATTRESAGSLDTSSSAAGGRRPTRGHVAVPTGSIIAESVGPGRERALAERQLSTLAARRPALRPVARRWRDRVAELARTQTPAMRSRHSSRCPTACASPCSSTTGRPTPPRPGHREQGSLLPSGR
ncbi:MULTISPECIES: hypothetical protein [unclassified Blastococcus]